MTTPHLFKHKTQESVLYLYAEVDGVSKPIRFFEKESAYSGQHNGHGGFYPVEIESRHIEFVDDIEKATKMLTLEPFIAWRKEAKEEYETFLQKHNLTQRDIGIVRVTYAAPTETLVDASFLADLF